ncbi:autotransporter domain-containing protein [Aerophototrophica crusticola]|uniref:Autotransporter domain-containing protein n=1 Tax=Aerophototrophica crusticola TaxID=1709002 RepID=A0A858R7H5_9PROT|nr:autotransporter domain-containing protein [Rhodospirillaceae bacterium B3]
MASSFRGLLLATALSTLALPVLAQSTTTLNGTTFTNQGLQGVGRMAANLKDKFGETFGSISGMQIDLRTWTRRADGSYAATLYTLPDRGYNVNATTNYIPRYNVVDLTFAPFTGASATAQNQIGLTLRDTILFTDNTGTPFTGFDPGTNGTALTYRPAANGLPNLPKAGNGRLALDPEAIVRTRDGSLWVSDEYGAYIYRFSASGQLLSAIRPPEALIPKRAGVDNFAAAEGTPANPTTGRQNNQGFEGLSLSADGKTLFVALQSAAFQDLNGSSVNTSRRNTRLLSYDVSNPSSPVLKGEWVIQLPQYNNNGNPAGPLNRVAAQSELLALNNSQFLLLSRDGNGYGSGATPNSSPTSFYRRIDLIDISGATNIAGTAYDTPGTPIAPNGVLAASITPVQFASFVDMNDAAQLAKFGLVNGAANNPNCRTQCLSEKWEALTLAPALDAARPDDFFLFVGNDNDFVTQDGFQAGAAYRDASGVENDTMLLAYRLTLPTYVDPLASESQQLTGGLLGQALMETGLSSQRAAAADQTGRTQAIRGGFAGNRKQGSFDLAAGGDWASADRSDSASRLSKPEGWSLGAGADYAVTDTLRVGVGFGYADMDGDFGDLGEARGKSWGVGPYATLALPGGFYADVSYRYVDVKLDGIRRNSFAYGLTATGETEGTGHSVAVELGSVLESGGWRFGPVLGVKYDRLKLDAWNEGSAIHLNLDHPGQTVKQTTLNLGGHLSTSVDLGGGMALVPELRAGYQADVSKDDTRSYTTVLSTRRTSPLGSQTALLAAPDDSGWRVGAGLGLAVSQGVTLLVNGETLFARGDDPDLAVGAALRVGF